MTTRFKFTRSQWDTLYDCVSGLSALNYEFGSLDKLCSARLRLAECGGTIDMRDTRLINEAQYRLHGIAGRDDLPHQTRTAVRRALAALRDAGASSYTQRLCECAACEDE
jgi:hypothetical protein